MFLLAYKIRLGQPGVKIGVDVAWMGQPKGVNMIPRRKRLHRTKARVLEPSREHHVSVEPAAPGCDLGERHSDLKGDPGLFRKDAHGSELADGGNNAIEKCANLGRLTAEVIGKLVRGACVRLVAISEIPPTLVAVP